MFLQEFTSARYVRLRLQRIRTLNADLMSFMHAKMKDIDPSVTNRVRIHSFWLDLKHEMFLFFAVSWVCAYETNHWWCEMWCSACHSWLSVVIFFISFQYFYSIKDISIGGQCICFGYARLCPVDPRTGVSTILKAWQFFFREQEKERKTCDVLDNALYAFSFCSCCCCCTVVSLQCSQYAANVVHNLEAK